MQFHKGKAPDADDYALSTATHENRCTPRTDVCATLETWTAHVRDFAPESYLETAEQPAKCSVVPKQDCHDGFRQKF